jgi:GDP-L-fucose synthase
MIWKNKKVLVFGSEGMIGKELVEQLKKLKAEVIRADIKECSDDNYYSCDVTEKVDVEEIISLSKPDYVISCFGIKGSPRMTKEKPVNFMYPMLVGDSNIIRFAQKYGVKKMLYTSSIAVEHPESDFYPAWAKLTAEHLIEAMRIQYPKGTKYCIVRPANVYGKYDNFNNPNAMVVTSLIKKALKYKKIDLMTDGTEIRDFINARDVARGMIEAMEQMPNIPVNLCSGKGITILSLCQSIINNMKGDIAITTKPIKADCMKRVMDLNWDFKPLIEVDDGVKEVIKYVKDNKIC